MATTTFGKKTAANAAAGTKPAFGKKVSPTATRRGAPAAQPGLSSDALAFLQTERGRAPAGNAGKSAQPSYAMPSAQPAGKPVWARRIVATLIDGAVFLVPLVMVITAMGPQPDMTDAQFATGYFSVILLLLVGGLAYSIGMESSSRQATLGKMAVGAIVTDKDGGKPTLGAVILRNTLGKFASGILPFYIGYLIGAARKDKRCLHDLISGTMVCAKGEASQSYANTFA